MSFKKTGNAPILDVIIPGEPRQPVANEPKKVQNEATPLSGPPKENPKPATN